MAQLSKLTAAKRIVAWRLSECRPVSLGELIDALYGDDPGGGPDAAVANICAYVHRLRKELAEFGIDIERGQHRIGWLIHPKHREELRTLLAREIAIHGECFSRVGGAGRDHGWPSAAVSVADGSVPAAVG